MGEFRKTGLIITILIVPGSITPRAIGSTVIVITTIRRDELSVEETVREKNGASCIVAGMTYETTCIFATGINLYRYHNIFDVHRDFFIHNTANKSAAVVASVNDTF